MYRLSLISSLPMYELLFQAYCLALVDCSFLKVVQWTFRNNGTTFRDEDWIRLRKIG